VSGNRRVFLTGRPHIEAEIIKCFSKVARIPLSPNQEDIKSYLEMKLNYVTNPYPMHDELRADIMRAIPDKISEMYQYQTHSQYKHQLLFDNRDS